METKIKVGLCAAIVLIISGLVWAGFGKETGTIDSCTATYQTYVTAKYSETYLTMCTRYNSEGHSYTTSCWQTRYWSKAASPVWVSRTVNGKHSSNANEAYMGNHGFYIHDIPPRDESLASHPDFDGFTSTRKAKLDIAVIMLGEYQTFDKETSAYKGCELMRKQKTEAVVKTWYGNAYDTELMF